MRTWYLILPSVQLLVLTEVVLKWVKIWIHCQNIIFYTSLWYASGVGGHEGPTFPSSSSSDGRWEKLIENYVLIRFTIHTQWMKHVISIIFYKLSGYESEALHASTTCLHYPPLRWQWHIQGSQLHAMLVCEREGNRRRESERRGRKEWRAVADAGIVEGGFFYCIAREVCAKNLGPCPILPKTTPIFKRFWEKLLVLPVNPFIFNRDLR